ncbi:hypothetical protein FKP32DRAFT_1576518, partial [Trametes sanguinea]
MAEDVRRQNAVPEPTRDVGNVAPDVVRLEEITVGQPTSSSGPEAARALEAVDVQSLKTDQLRAYNIVKWHLDETLRGAAISPLRMCLVGEGGTGKSRVIQTITQYFASRGVEYLLVKGAYTGIAAALIGGKTTHA